MEVTKLQENINLNDSDYDDGILNNVLSHFSCKNNVLSCKFVFILKKNNFLVEIKPIDK